MTDNERDAQTIREALTARRAAMQQQTGNAVGLLVVAHLDDALAALARLVAALSAATTERDEAREARQLHFDIGETLMARARAAEQRAGALAAVLDEAREALDRVPDDRASDEFYGRNARYHVRKACAALAAAAPAATEEP